VRPFAKFARRYRENTNEMRAYDSFESALRDSDSYEDPRLVEIPNAPNGRSSQPLTLVSWDALAATIPANYEVVFKFVESEERMLSISGRSISVRDIGFLAYKP